MENCQPTSNPPFLPLKSLTCKFFCTPFTFYKNLYGKLCLLTFIRVGTENTFSHILPKGFYLDMGLCTTFTFIRVSMENCVLFTFIRVGTEMFYFYKSYYRTFKHSSLSSLRTINVLHFCP